MTIKIKVITQVDQVLAITYVYGGLSFYEDPF